MSFNDLDDSSPSIRQPKGLKVKLRPHQLTSVCAMSELEKQGTIIIDRPAINSGMHQTVKYRITDTNEVTNSTFVMETNSAILADKVGSGKTYMVIGLILHTLVPKIHDRFIVGTDHFSIKMITNNNSESTNLIVVPHNLTNQWEGFIKKSTLTYLKLNNVSDFDVFFDMEYVMNKNVTYNSPLVVYNNTRKKNLPKSVMKKLSKANGSKTSKNAVTGRIYEKRTLNATKIREVLNNTNIILLNVNRYRLFKQIFRSTKWARVIFDEMDSINIPTMFDEYGNFNWFLTATPTSIFYKSCRRYVNKIFGYNQNLLDYFIVRNKDSYVDTSIVLPKPYVFIVNTLLKKVFSAIQDLIPTDVLQLINSGNVKEAIAKLNCDVDTEENIVKVLTDKIKTEHHNLTKELEYVRSLIPTDPDAHEKRIQKIKTEISRLNVKLETVNERIKSIKDECCFICTESFENPAILSCCKSVFCLKCLVAALKSGDNKCPICRHKIKSNKEYHVISTKPIVKVVSEPVTGRLFGDMDKPDALEKILRHIASVESKPRILIFSDYPQTFEKIIKNIAKAGLQYSLLSGIPAHISNVISEFKAGTTNILMLDSKHYGSGLNLQDATYLILYHRMLPELETQVIGRAQRFGRKTPLKIIYLVNNSESHFTKLTTNPTNLQSENQLSLISNPLGLNNAEEEYIDSDSEPKPDINKSTKPKKSSKKKSSKKKLSKKKSSKKKSSKTILAELSENSDVNELVDTDSELSAGLNDANEINEIIDIDSESLEIVVTKKKSKRKTKSRKSTN